MNQITEMTIGGSRYATYVEPYDRRERPSCPELDKLIGVRIKVLDKGYICVRDYMGDWRNVSDTARMSYSSQTGKQKTAEEDVALIKSLLRRRHTSPFEANAIRIEARAPIHVIRQWFRHRTGSPNEESARYSIIEDVMYEADVSVISPQSLTNKQGREADGFSDEQKKEIARILLEANQESYKTYDRLLQMGLTRELARSVLNTNTYSRFSFKIDLHNLLKMLALRAEAHAQYEIRQYAQVLESIVAVWTPPIYRAYLEYIKYGMSLGQSQVVQLFEALGGEGTARVFARTCNKSEYRDQMNRVMLAVPGFKVTPEGLMALYEKYKV